MGEDPDRVKPPLSIPSSWRFTDTADRESAIGAWLRERQRETGAEHVAILTCDGEATYVGTSGQRFRVGTPLADDGIDVVIHHSHPDESSLSTADFAVAWRRSRGSEVRAYTPAGSIFRGRSLLEPESWHRRRNDARLSIASELRILGRRDGAFYAYLASHLANAEMESFGLLWYESDLAPETERDLNALLSDLPRLRLVIRRELEGDD